MSESYQGFYKAQISRAVSSGSGLAGLIGVGGPTGLGKTSSLLHSSHGGEPAALTTIREAGKKAIFVTHRWNILTGFSKDARSAGVEHSVLYSRVEQISAAVCGHALSHEDSAPDGYLWESELEQIKDQQTWVHPSVCLSKLYKNCAAVERIYSILNEHKSHKQPVVELNAELESRLSQKCAEIERWLLENMAQLKAQQKGSDKPKKRRNNIGSVAVISKLSKFRKSALVRRALPGVVWSDDAQTLLIMTTHKLYQGFYDGSRRVRMGESHLSDHVIFIDEFEYQEPVLLGLLSQEQRVQELPQCLGVLLDEGNRLIARAEEGHPDDEGLHEVLTEIRKGFDQTVEALNEKGITFPNDRALVRASKEQFEPRCLFSSSYFVSLKPTYLLPDRIGLKVVNEKGKSAVSANFFLTELEKLLRKTLFCISNLSSDAQAYSGRTLQEEFLHLIFNSVNDYRQGHYHQSLNSPSFLSAAPNTNLEELKLLLASEELPNTRATLLGFSCWLLRQAPEQLDNMRVEQRRAHIPTTPEALLVALASRNLVFGLSATSMISRSIGNFDMKWIYGALQQIAVERRGDEPEKPFPVIPDRESEDLLRSTVSHLKQVKASKRKNTATIVEMDLDKSPGFEVSSIADALPGDFFDIDEEQPSETSHNYRKRCLLASLNILMLVAESRDHKGHLAYVNSMRFVRKWLNSQDAYDSRQQCPWLEVLGENELQVLSVSESFASSSDFKLLRINGVLVTVCLLNAEAQKSNSFEENYQTAFDVSESVLVLTQVASATNGINLDYSSSTELGVQETRDLTCVYLFEGRHYFFSAANSEFAPHAMAQVGSQIRSLQKLRQSTQISEKDYRHVIGALMSQDARIIGHLNNDVYKRTRDYAANIIADIQQQLGRLERVWAEVPQTKIVVQSELAETVKSYARDPFGFEEHRHSMSTLNEAFFDHFKSASDENTLMSLLFSAPQNDSEAIEFVDEQLVPAIRRSRQGEWNACSTSKLKRAWDRLGGAFLRRDLCFDDDYSTLGLNAPQRTTLKNWACASLPVDADISTGVWITQDGRYLPQPAPDAYRYSLSAYYRWVQHHEYITRWFSRGGYATSGKAASGDEERYVYFPSLAQRILQGRIGEEAVRGLLKGFKVNTSTELLSERCLELYDFHIPGTNFFVDAKYWGVKTLREADDAFESYLASGKTELVPMSLPEKLAQMRQHIRKDAKLVIANLVGVTSDSKIRFYDSEFNVVSPRSADIIVIPGCLNPEQRDDVSLAFQGFVELVEMAKAESFSQQGGIA